MPSVLNAKHLTMEQMRTRCNDLTQFIESLGKDYKALEIKYADAKNRSTINNEMFAEEFRKINEQLSARQEEVKKAKEELASLSAQSQADKKEIETLQQQLDQASTASNSLEESYKKQIEELEKAKKDIATERDSLKAEKDALKDELQVIKTVVSKKTGINTSSALISVNRLIERVERSKTEDEFKRLEEELNLVKATAFSDKTLKAQYEEANNARFRSIARQAELTKDLNKAKVTIQKQEEKIAELEKADKVGKTAKRHEDYLTEENKKYKGKLDTSSKMLTQTKAELRREQKAADELNSALIGEMAARNEAEQERDTAKKGWVKNKKFFKIAVAAGIVVLVAGVSVGAVLGNKNEKLGSQLTASEKQEMINAQGTVVAEADGYYLAGNTTVDNAETHEKAYKGAIDEGVEALSVTAEDSYTTYYNAILDAKVDADEIRYSLDESYENYKTAVEASNEADIETYATEISEYKADLLKYSQNVQTIYDEMVGVSGHSADEWINLAQALEESQKSNEEKDQIIQEKNEELAKYGTVKIDDLNNYSQTFQDFKTAFISGKGGISNIRIVYQSSNGVATITYDKKDVKTQELTVGIIEELNISTGYSEEMISAILVEIADELGLDIQNESEM